MRLRIRQTVGELLELAVITTFVVVVLWEERRQASARTTRAGSGWSPATFEM
jgi:hypothetical protein